VIAVQGILFRRYLSSICWSVLLPPLLLLAAGTGAVARAQIVQIGKGSYSTAAPGGVRLPPRSIFQTGSVRGKMPTNDWWSSLAWEPYSSNQFPHPLAVCAGKEGLRVSYPGLEIHAVPKHILAGMKNDLVLGQSSVTEFQAARVDGFSDWFVDVLFDGGGRTMRVSYGHGSPFIYALFEGGGASIRFDAPVKIWSGGADSPALGITVKRRHYGLFGPADSTWRGLESRTLVNENRGKRHFSLALLPDDRPGTLALFQETAHNHVTGTRVTWRYFPSRGVVETTHTFETERREGRGRGTLFALYPHQWLATRNRLLPQSYASVRGPLRLGAGSGFTTSMRFPGVLPALPDAGACDRDRLKGYLREAAKKKFKDAPDTYWSGKAMGVISNLIPLAEQLGERESLDTLLGTLKGRLEDWFTCSPGKRDHYFFYDETWGTLIGQRPSYGTCDQLNDHHFHYGYFIRAAAEIARLDRSWASARAWGGMVDLLIRDIASGDRGDGKFPFLRCFDPYAGHSWASGSARFGDGNNQESSSEAMNAWTGIILWGEATGNQALRDLGIYLYTTELHAIQAYWFDVENRFFHEGYGQTCAALIWGGKTDYATWFSAEPEHTHGIILLPIQSGSLYLGLHPEYVRRNLDGLARLRGSTDWKHWKEIFWMYEALYSADGAMARFEAGSREIDSQARPFVYHWIGNLQRLGQVDRTVTADRPTAIAFSKNGKRTHVAYNLTGRPITVRFSDGALLLVPPGKFSVKGEE